jgi:hypothetical protein
MQRTASFHRQSRRIETRRRSPLRRRWAIFSGIVIAAVGYFAYSGLQTAGVVPRPGRTERIGLFEIEHKVFEELGGRGRRAGLGVQRTLFYVGGSRRQLVSQSITNFRLNPHEPRIIIYETCPMNSAENCGVHLYDGRSMKQWQISGEQQLSNAGELQTSADGRYMMLGSQFELLVIDLMQPNTKDLTATLGLRAGSRSLRLGEWSPDRKRITAFVGHYVDPAPPFVTLAEDLYVIDPADGSARYVATAQPRGWRDQRYEWVPTALGYSVAVSQALPGFGSIYQKDSTELPLGPQYRIGG